MADGANSTVVKPLQASALQLHFQDLYEYYKEVQSSKPLDCEVAYRHKSQPTSDQLGLGPWDTMQDLESLPARIAYVNQLHEQVCGGVNGTAARVRVASYTMWSGNMWSLRRSILPSLQWGLHTGICRFYLLYTGKGAAVVDALQEISCVKLLFVRPPFASDAVHAAWRKYAAAHSRGRPGAYYRMAMQTFGGNQALVEARSDRYQWLMHMGADELLLPGTSLADELLAAPPWVASVKFFNHEAQAEVVDIVNKYEQVTLFRSNLHLSPGFSHDIGWRFRQGDPDNGWWMLHVNGRAIVRMDSAPVRMWGVHHFTGPDDARWVHPEGNPTGKFLEVRSNSSAVLHYTYTNWHDLVSKSARACPKRYRLAAAANNITMLKECFIMSFDMRAYQAALQGCIAARRFWVVNALLSEGAFAPNGPYKGARKGCLLYPNVSWLKDSLVRAGAMVRISAVREVLQGQELGMRLVAQQMGVPVTPLGGVVLDSRAGQG